MCYIIYDILHNCNYTINESGSNKHQHQSLRYLTEQKKNICQHIQKAYTNHRDWSCDAPMSFRLQSCCFFRGPRSARGSHRTSSFLFSWSFGDDVLPIQADVFFWASWLLFHTPGKSTLIISPCFLEKTSFFDNKNLIHGGILCRKRAIKHNPTLAAESFAGLFRVKASQRTRCYNMTSKSCIFSKETQSYWVAHPISHVGHLFIVPPVCRHFDAFWNSINAFNIT